MIILIAGTILSFLMLIFSWKISIAVLAVTLVLLFIPLEGYENKQVNRIKLLQLEDPLNPDAVYYLELGKNKAVYAFDNSKAYDIPTVASERKTVRGKIRVYESAECKEPMLKLIEQKPIRKEGFAFAFFATKKEYIFYVPKGTVIRKTK